MISPRFIVGFAGHRNLQNPKPIADAIRTTLLQLREQAGAAGGDVELFCSIAYGADTLAAETARNLGIPVHLVLPKAIQTDHRNGAVKLDQGFAADFWDKPADGPKTFRQQDWDRAWKQIQDAQQGTDGGTLRLVRGSQSNPECYYDAGVQVLDACDALVAVWDGKEARGLGGTAEMVAHIRATEPKRTLVIIDANTAALSSEHAKAFASTSEVRMREVAQLNDLMRERCATPVNSSEEVQRCLSATAEDEAKKFRYSIVATILLHGIATIIAALAAILPKHEAWSGWTLVILCFLEFVLVVRAWHLSRRHRQRHTHERWLRARFGADLVRGLRGAAAFLDPLSPQVARHKPEWSRFALAVGLMTSFEIDRSKTWQERRDVYSKARLDKQIKYFTDKQKLAAKTVNRTQFIADWAIRLAPLCVFFALAAKVWHVYEEHQQSASLNQLHPFTWGSLGADVLVRFLPILIPLVAGIASGLRTALDANRRKYRYGELAERLNATAKSLRELKTETTVRHSILAIEEVLLDELIEWHLAEKQNAGH